VYEARQSLFYEGTPSVVLHCLREGRVKMWRHGVNGETQMLGIRGPGHLVGIRPVLTGRPYTSTAEAIARCVVCSFPADRFVAAVREHADFAYALLRRMAEISFGFEDELVFAALATVRQRLAAYLERFGSAGPGNTAARGLTREELALLVGTNPETLSRTLHAMADERVLALNGREVRVLDPDRLARIARGPAGAHASS
jgi:CRP-like cAMP-binding protein